MARQWDPEIDRKAHQINYSSRGTPSPQVYYYGYDKGKREERYASAQWMLEPCQTHYTAEDDVSHHRCSACIEEVCVGMEAPWDTPESSQQ